MQQQSYRGDDASTALWNMWQHQQLAQHHQQHQQQHQQQQEQGYKANGVADGEVGALTASLLAAGQLCLFHLQAVHHRKMSIDTILRGAAAAADGAARRQGRQPSKCETDVLALVLTSYSCRSPTPEVLRALQLSQTRSCGMRRWRWSRKPSASRTTP